MISDILSGPTGTIRAGRGSGLRAKSWRTEGLLRLFENTLEVAQNPAELVVCGSAGRAARSWQDARVIAQTLLELPTDQTLILQSGAPAGVIPTSPEAPRVLSAVNNTVGAWSGADRFAARAAAGQTIDGGLTAAAWQYIGRQGALQSNYELLRIVLEQHFWNGGAGRWLLTAGLGAAGSSQPIAARLAGLSSLTVEVDQAKIDQYAAGGQLTAQVPSLEVALAELAKAETAGKVVALALCGNAAEVFPQVAAQGVLPDIVSDQTAAHDARHGYVPAGYDLATWHTAREHDPEGIEAAALASITQQVRAICDLQDAGAVAFENGNHLRLQALRAADPSLAERISRLPGFAERYLRPLLARGIGPFRWIALSGDPYDLRVLDDLAAGLFPGRPEVAQWIKLARAGVPTQGLPARSCWLGHGERSMFATEVNRLVAAGKLRSPVAFSRGHLDAASLTHPMSGTENLRDGSAGATDWPLLDALALAACGADLVAVHAGGGDHSGWLQSTGVTIVADGVPATTDRLQRALDADTGLGVLRYAAAGHPEAIAAADRGGELGTAPLGRPGGSPGPAGLHVLPGLPGPGLG
ncbi:MAG: urocanate hydratase [Bifidobacteriaceae bacterium]|jgi:urocanate hydratase|nr:urocanate hydratase [Bifidobacteriaceae bacterium]